MEFDKSRVYTALNADKLEPGDVVFAAGTLAELKKFDFLRLSTISCILSEDCACRFRITDDSSWTLAYLIAKHDDPYKEFKKAQAEGQEVWLEDVDGKWKSNKTNHREWRFTEPAERYSLTGPVKDKVVWQDFSLFDEVEYDDIEQFVSAIDKRDTNCRIFLSYSGWIADNELKDIKRLED